MLHSAKDEHLELKWCTCAACWGQRKIYRRVGDALRRFTCPWCLGVGESLRIA